VKKFVRTPGVQSVLAWLVSAYLALALATIRWRFENRTAVETAAKGEAGAIGCFWHGRIGLAPVCRRVLGRKPRRVLISNSPDGEFIAKVVRKLGFPAIRGSSTTDPRRNRRSIEAFREAVSFLDDGGAVVVTPDGPRGPAERMPQGPVMLARTRQTPVFLVGLAARPVLSLRSWDRTQIPLPFGRGCVVFDGPFTIACDAGPQAVEATRMEWQARLCAAQAKAEQLLATP
jgi:lysophospholipid acyltransferase (LPLAT)-like uncharacterized protein